MNIELEVFKFFYYWSLLGGCVLLGGFIYGIHRKIGIILASIGLCFVVGLTIFALSLDWESYVFSYGAFFGGIANGLTMTFAWQIGVHLGEKAKGAWQNDL